MNSDSSPEQNSSGRPKRLMVRIDYKAMESGSSDPGFKGSFVQFSEEKAQIKHRELHPEPEEFNHPKNRAQTEETETASSRTGAPISGKRARAIQMEPRMALPNSFIGLKKELALVDHLLNLSYVKFFEEEASDNEIEANEASYELGSENSGTADQDQAMNALSPEAHNRRLQKILAKSQIKQFWSIPICDTVLNKRMFLELAQAQAKHGGRLFDVIMCDPPWKLSSTNPTRGVTIAYSTLSDKEIFALPFHRLQKQGFLFIWVINCKFQKTLDNMEALGYRFVDYVDWIKQTVNGKVAKGHGFYLQHAKETCLIYYKGEEPRSINVEYDVIFSERKGQSQKPDQIYDLAEALSPNGYYLEIFGRRNNLRNGWVTVGNEL